MSSKQKASDTASRDWQEAIEAARDGAGQINPMRKLTRKLAADECRVERTVPRDVGMVDGFLMDLFHRLAAGSKPWPLYLHGEPGRGKTMAGLALCDLVRGARYFTPQSLIETCAHHEHLLPWMPYGHGKDIELAVLDEVGAGTVNDWHYRMVKAFVDDRELQHHRTAVYISNLPPSAIEGKYDSRIASRILCGTLYELTGLDRRIEPSR